MKTSKLRIIAILLLILANTFDLFSQSSSNMVKYWYYRNRLNKYFVIPGTKIGESQIICVRNRMAWPDNDDLKNIDYGQHGKYTGLYLGVLATEYYLLKRNGQYADAAQTHEELYKALNAVKIFWDKQQNRFMEVV